MKMTDVLYGEIEVTDPFLLEIIEHPAFQRLKRINQYGGVNFVYPDRYQTTRFEHTLGVWYLVQKLGVSQEVQVAALLHDVGHTAFSHMIDMAMASKTEDYHEQFVHLLPGYDDLMKLVASHGITLQPVDSYPELKKSLPDVGADRLDYGVRDHVSATGETSDLGKRVAQNIRLLGRDIVFTDLETAHAYAVTANQGAWDTIYEPSVAVVYQLLTEIVRQGLEAGWITTQDILQDDAHMFALIQENRQKLPTNHQDFLTRPFSVEAVSCDGPFDVKHVKLKVRYFNPYVLVEGEKLQLSGLHAEFAHQLEEMKKKFERRTVGECFAIRWKE